MSQIDDKQQVSEGEKAPRGLKEAFGHVLVLDGAMGTMSQTYGLEE